MRKQPNLCPRGVQSLSSVQETLVSPGRDGGRDARTGSMEHSHKVETRKVKKHPGSMVRNRSLTLHLQCHY